MITIGTIEGPGITPSNGDPQDMILDVITTSGTAVAADDPALVRRLPLYRER